MRVWPRERDYYSAQLRLLSKTLAWLRRLAAEAECDMVTSDRLGSLALTAAKDEPTNKPFFCANDHRIDWGVLDGSKLPAPKRDAQSAGVRASVTRSGVLATAAMPLSAVPPHAPPTSLLWLTAEEWQALSDDDEADPGMTAEEYEDLPEDYEDPDIARTAEEWEALPVDDEA